jgi:hypothetical protein
MSTIPLSELAESARESARDGSDLANEMAGGGGDPDKLARVADRLAEEYADLAAALWGLPPR